MGKAGDLLYFLVWMSMLSLGAAVEEGSAVSTLAWLDFTGLAHAMNGLRSQVDTQALGIGMMNFDAALPPHTLPQWMWTAAMVRDRSLSAVLALLPLLPALQTWLQEQEGQGVGLASRRSGRAPDLFWQLGSLLALAMATQIQSRVVCVDRRCLSICWESLQRRSAVVNFWNRMEIVAS